MPSFLLALRHGADALELDAHATKDGVVVVHHDDIVKQHSIADATWRELSKIDLGGGSHIPRLQDVLDAVGERATSMTRSSMRCPLSSM
jgi:glycerophosphoryl diester phosphodiesterase